jgi:hypothetical protein
MSFCSYCLCTIAWLRPFVWQWDATRCFKYFFEFTVLTGTRGVKELPSPSLILFGFVLDLYITKSYKTPDRWFCVGLGEVKATVTLWFCCHVPYLLSVVASTGGLEVGRDRALRTINTTQILVFSECLRDATRILIFCVNSERQNKHNSSLSPVLWDEGSRPVWGWFTSKGSSVW